MASPSPKRAKKKQQREKKLQYLCQQWMEKEGTLARLLIFHVANERIGGVGTAVHFKRMGVLAGVADYLAFPPGRAAAIELKDKDEDPRQTQLDFQRRWEAAGNAYFVCRTLEEFQGVVRGLLFFA